ncbi:MAG: hypothetical protein LT071_05235, partial [Nocardioides sp.]|nr:hypothetical protein [Nocardioides sp.]
TGGRLYEPADPRALAEVLAEVDRDPDRFVRLGRAGLATHRTRFSAEVSLDRLLEVYRFAVANPVGATRVRA